MGCAPTSRLRNLKPAGMVEEVKVESELKIYDDKLIKKIKDKANLSDSEYEKLLKGDIKVNRNYRSTLVVKSMNFNIKDHLQTH